MSTLLSPEATQAYGAFQASLDKMLEGTGVTISPQDGILLDGLKGHDLVAAGRVLMAVSASNKHQRKLIDWYIGQLIVNHAVINDCTWTESISVLELVKDTGREFKTLIKLPRMVSILPEEAFNLPVTAGHLEAVTSFASPKQVDDLREFNHARMELLKEAAQDPDEKNRTWITEKMRELQREFKVDGTRGKTPTNDVRKAFEHCSQAIVEWTDEDYEAFGVDRGQLLDWWTVYRDDLIERGLLCDNTTDPTVFTLPWRKQNDTGKTIEAEILDCTEDDEPPPADATI